MGVRTEVVVAQADAAGFVEAVRAAASSGLHVVALVDDGSRVRTAVPNVEVFEPEDLLTDGVSKIAGEWERGVGDWLSRVFPGDLAGLPLSEILWAAVFCQPSLVDRVYEVALARELFSRFTVERVRFVGTPPTLTSVVRSEAERRGVAISAGHYPSASIVSAAARGAASAALAVGRFGLRIARRKRIMRRVRELAPSHGAAPDLALGVTSRFFPAARHIIESVAAPCEQANVPYAMLLQINVGDAETWEGIDETAMLDGRVARLRPNRVDQIAGVESWREGAVVLRRWAPIALRSFVGALRDHDALAIGGLASSSSADLVGLLRVALNDALRVCDAHRATELYVAANPQLRRAVFGAAPLSEVKVADLTMQAVGVRTHDFVHCLTYAGDIRAIFRSCSDTVLAWTTVEEALLAGLGTNGRVIGGFMPRRIPLAPESRTRGRRVLVTTNYLAINETVLRKHRKYAVRLADGVNALPDRLGVDVTIVLRPHPAERLELWKEMLDPRIVLSNDGPLSEALADASLVIASPSSAVLEALFYRVPVLLHHGPVIEPGTLFALFPRERRFATTEELCERSEALLRSGDAACELGILEQCFGRELQPRRVLDILRNGDTSPRYSKSA